MVFGSRQLAILLIAAGMVMIGFAGLSGAIDANPVLTTILLGVAIVIALDLVRRTGPPE